MNLLLKLVICNNNLVNASILCFEFIERTKNTLLINPNLLNLVACVSFKNEQPM